MLPIHEKLMESVVFKQLIEYIKKQDSIINVQYGFRHGNSCETSLHYVIAQWKDEIERGNIIIATFVDFQKAFETIPTSQKFG